MLSINRGFSAPVIVETERPAADLAFLSAHDDDPFARYEAMQQLMLDTLLAAIGSGRLRIIGRWSTRCARTLADETLDPAFVADAVLPPSEAFIGDQMAVVDPDAIRAARDALRAELGRTLEPQWRAAYASTAANRYEYSPGGQGRAAAEDGGAQLSDGGRGGGRSGARPAAI